MLRKAYFFCGKVFNERNSVEKKTTFMWQPSNVLEVKKIVFCERRRRSALPSCFTSFQIFFVLFVQRSMYRLNMRKRRTASNERELNM